MQQVHQTDKNVRHKNSNISGRGPDKKEEGNEQSEYEVLVDRNH